MISDDGLMKETGTRAAKRKSRLDRKYTSNAKRQRAYRHLKVDRLALDFYGIICERRIILCQK